MVRPPPTVTTDPPDFTPGDHVEVTIHWHCGCSRVERRVRLAGGRWRMHTRATEPHLVEQLCSDHRRELQATGTRPRR